MPGFEQWSGVNDTDGHVSALMWLCDACILCAKPLFREIPSFVKVQMTFRTPSFSTFVKSSLFFWLDIGPRKGLAAPGTPNVLCLLNADLGYPPSCPTKELRGQEAATRRSCSVPTSHTSPLPPYLREQPATKPMNTKRGQSTQPKFLSPIITRIAAPCSEAIRYNSARQDLFSSVVHRQTRNGWNHVTGREGYRRAPGFLSAHF